MITVKIEGMSCGHCVAHATKALQAIAGENVVVSLENKEAVINTEKDITDEAIKEAITEAGYEVTGISR